LNAVSWIIWTTGKGTRRGEGESAMLQRFLACGLLAALVVVLPLAAADDKKGKKDDPKQAPVDSDKLSAGDYTGKLLTAPDPDGTFTLQVETKRTEPKNPNQLSKKEAQLQTKIQQSQQKIANLQAQIIAARTAKEATHHQTQLQKELTHLQQLMAQSQLKPGDLKEVTDTQVYEMKLTDGADVRYMNLPTVFDDEGKPKKYTDKEKQELRGKKTNLPGYEGKVDDLKPGQTVKVTQVRVYPKAAPKDDAKKDDEKNDDPKKDDLKKDDPKKDTPAKDAPKDAGDKPAEKKMQVKLIVILEDAPDQPDPKGKKKKDK
jgi:hypothetical protein